MTAVLVPGCREVVHPVSWAQRTDGCRVHWAETGTLRFRGMPHNDHRPVSTEAYSSYLVELHNVFVFAGHVKGSRFFYVLTDDGSLLVDGLNFHPRHHLSVNQVCCLRGTKACFSQSIRCAYGPQQTAGVLLGGMPNVYHWYLEYFSRLKYLPPGLVDDVPLLLNADASPLQLETLRLAGISSVSSCLSMWTATRVGRLWLPSVPVLADAARHVQSLIGGSSGSAVDARMRVYVARSDAVEARVSNPNALEAYYEAQGYQVVQLTGLSFGDQRQLFSRALSIVGPHGAGLVNVLFAPREAVLTEIVNEQTSRYSFFSDLAETLGQTYCAVWDPFESRGRNIDPSGSD
jgi:hypothetical protein